MIDWDYDAAAHLLRRAGFGAPKADVERAVKDGQAKTVDRLLDFRPSKSRYRGKADTYRMQRWWILRMLKGKHPLAEKLTLFWHGHFATSVGKVEDVGMMSGQNGLFRLAGAGKFRDLLLQVSRDPAMIVFLDNLYNVKGNPNENYAREIMELFTLGVRNEAGQPNYTEADVRDAARAFTGWGLDDRGRFEFHPDDHDDGSKTVLGVTGNLDGTDVVDLLASRAECARYLARRLWRFFAYPDPETAVVDALAQAYAGADTEIAPVLRALFLRDEFYSDRALEERVASPAEFVAGTLRSVGAKTNGWDLPYYLAGMGQDLFSPPNVAGWPGGLSWMTSVTRLRRHQFAWDVATSRGRNRYLSAPIERLLRELPEGATTGDVVDMVLRVTGPVRLSAASRAVLVGYMDTDEEGQPSPFDPSDPDAVDEKLRGLAGLVLTLPEAHLA